MRRGEQSVTLSGCSMMQQLSAESLASHNLVCQYAMYLMMSFLVSLYLGATSQTDAFFGAGTGPIHLGSVQCDGTEANLVECPRGNTDLCTHADDAGVTCQPSTLPQLCDV